MEKQTITIEIPAGKRAEWVNGVLTLIDEPKQDNRPITERIKIFEDAYKWCEENDKENLVLAYNETSWRLYDIADVADVFAYLKLRIITCALNEGWEPTFAEDEWRYFPWFCIYSKEEWERLSDEQKARVVGRAVNNANANGGLVFAYAFSASSDSYTHCGSRLAFKSEELAEYAGKQFIDIYKDFVTL